MSSSEGGTRTPLRYLRWRLMLARADPFIADRWRWVRRHLVGGDRRTLDAGCASGLLTTWAVLQGNQAVGLAIDSRDIDRARARAARLGLRRVDFALRDLRKLDEYVDELGTFDQILLTECIEHIRDDEKLIRDLARLLRPGGRIFLTTPFSGHRPLPGETVSEIEDGGHVRFGYTHEEIAALFSRAGLQVDSIGFLNGPGSQVAARALLRIGPENQVLSWALTYPLRILRLLDGGLARLMAYPPLSIAVIGRKPSAAGG